MLSRSVLALLATKTKRPARTSPRVLRAVTASGKADGVPLVFDQNDVVGDDLFIDDGELTVAEIQSFLEDSPYNNRSWLADYTINGVSAAQAIYNAATGEGIHPMTILARMQVEASLVSKTTQPSASRLNAALGCGCPDGGACASQYRGFDKQLVCGAKILRKAADDVSVAGTGSVPRRPLDAHARSADGLARQPRDGIAVPVHAVGLGRSRW